MATHIVDYRSSSMPRSDSIYRRLQLTFWETIHRIASRDPESSSMAPHLDSRAIIAARSTLSGGAIAGAVVGSLIGAAIISVIVGFLYFRWKRQSHSVVADEDKPPEIERRLSFPGPDQTAGQPQFTPAGYAGPGTGNVQVPRDDPVWAPRMDHEQYALSGNDINFNNSVDRFQVPYQSNFEQDPEFPSQDGQDPAESTEYVPAGVDLDGNAAAASYYDTNIAMDSEPEDVPSSGPTRQMTQLYEEQLRKSRESRQNSKGSSWSRLTKGFLSKRKRSTRVSEITMEEGHAQSQSSTTSHPDTAIASIEGASGNVPEQIRSFGQDAQLFEEPQEMSDSSRVDTHAHKKTKRRGPSGDTPVELPHRIGSLQSNPTLDSQLPSAALRQKPIPSDKSVARQLTRFQSPELPGLMDIDDNDFVADDRSSAVRGSNSPPLNSAGFSAVNPMDIMPPSNATEQAVFTNAELERIASTSVSPPTSPPYHANTPPVTHDQDAAADHDLDVADHADESESDSDDADEGLEFDEAPQIAIDDTFVIDGPSDWSTPAGTTLTNASSGRTPGTDITLSPSPAPSNGLVMPENSISPPTSAESPKHVLTCEECGRTFDQIHKLNHHKRYHDRKHVCTFPDCGRKFGTKTHLDRHINDKHEKKKGFHCTQEGCQYFIGGKSFPRKDNWRRHMINKHGITPTAEPQPAD